jgi:hypothetical protein
MIFRELIQRDEFWFLKAFVIIGLRIKTIQSINLALC